MKTTGPPEGLLRHFCCADRARWPGSLADRRGATSCRLARFFGAIQGAQLSGLCPFRRAEPRLSCSDGLRGNSRAAFGPFPPSPRRSAASLPQRRSCATSPGSSYPSQLIRVTLSSGSESARYPSPYLPQGPPPAGTDPARRRAAAAKPAPAAAGPVRPADLTSAQRLLRWPALPRSRPARRS